jgi:hypothetical protein
MKAKKKETEPRVYSRRDILAGSTALLAGGLIGGAAVAQASTDNTTQ